MTTNNNSKNGCPESWKSDLEYTQNQLEFAQIRADKAKTAYDNSAAWEAQLKAYIDRLENTGNLSLKVKKDIRLMLEQIQILGQNANQVKRALTLVYDMVIAYYAEIDVLLGRVNGLLTEINDIGDASINAETSKVVACLTNFKTALETTLEGRNDAIANLVDVLEAIYVLLETNNNSVAACEGETSAGANCGFTDTLDTLYSLYDSNMSDGGLHSWLLSSELPMPNGIGSCDLPNEAYLPFLDHYYLQKVREAYDKASNQTEAAESAYEEASRDLRKQEECKTRLENAIAAADEAKGCS